MGMDSSGRDNRIAKRDFYENNITAENFVDGDLVNISFPVTEKDTRPLVPAQRRQLHQLILSVAEAGGEEGYEVWQRVHAEIGVKCVEEMTIDQYHPACAFLRTQIDLINEKHQKKELISALLRISTNNHFRHELTQYCRKSFGTSHLKKLSRSDLKQALLWLDDECSKDPLKVDHPTINSSSWWRLAWDYPVFTGAVFLAGFAVAAIIDTIFLF